MYFLFYAMTRQGNQIQDISTAKQIRYSIHHRTAWRIPTPYFGQHISQWSHSDDESL